MAVRVGPGVEMTVSEGPGVNVTVRIGPGVEAAVRFGPGVDVAVCVGPGMETAIGPGFEKAVRVGPGMEATVRVGPGLEATVSVRPGLETAVPLLPPFSSPRCHYARCEKKCCEIETFPLRMAIGLTRHKAQGMTIAKDEPFEKAVLHFPTSATKKVTVGLKYVMAGRVKTLSDFAIGNKITDLDRTKLLKIGTMIKAVGRREIQQMIRERYERVDRPRVKAKIAASDTVEVQTFEGGCRSLRKWYREKF